MRLPMNDTFFRVDPDCAAFTDQVDAEMNLRFMELCALTGVTTFASITPGSLTGEQMKRINAIFRLADSGSAHYGIRHYERCAIPETFTNGREERRFNWMEYYDGSRTNLSWSK